MGTSPISERWRLPDGVDELQPAAVRRVESLRQAFLELGSRWGFVPVSPPLIESLDGLLTGSGELMQRDTFQIVDQLDGRILGVRADMTPQVARMDAQLQTRSGPNRLLYTGTVLRTRADGIGASRNPQQFGAELFGHAGSESDIEIVRLMLETVRLTGVQDKHLVLDLGHVGVYAGLLASAQLDEHAESTLFDALVRGSAPDARQLIKSVTVEGPKRKRACDALLSLTQLSGSLSVIERARAICSGIDSRVDAALEHIENVISAVLRTHPDVSIHVDLCELHGYRYHTGLLFAVHDATGQRLARGGRYDAVGKAFGSTRAATGFSGDLKQLSELVADSADESIDCVGIAADDLELPGAWDAVAALRASGQAVLTLLPDTDAPATVTAKLVRDGAEWQTLPVGGR